MAFGSNTLQRGVQGPEVIELQLRLSGFRGAVWDGDYGPATELQVITFQRDYMGMENPNGITDASVFQALKQFAEEHPIDFDKLKCPCGQCNGFGEGRYKGQYRGGATSGPEQRNMYEYPGIHKAILHASRAAQFYGELAGFGRAYPTSGYRCWYNNEQKGRTSTNHMGKAIDIDFPLQPGEDKEDDRNRCDLGRAMLVEKSNFQIGWGGANQKALEPSNIAPTWIHMDVRNYNPALYLKDEYFVTDSAALDAIEIDAAAATTPVKRPAAAAQPAASSKDKMAEVASLLNSINMP